MRCHLAWIALLSLLLGTGCKTTPSKTDAEKPYRGATFELNLPASVTVDGERGDGFAVHYFRVGNSHCMMGIYEGIRPHLFSSKEKDLTVMRRGVTTRDRIDHGEDVWGVDSNGGQWRESLWNCTRIVHDREGKKIKIPGLIHIWYFGAKDEEQALFDTMIDGLSIVD